MAFLKRIGERLPKSPKELGKIQLRLVQAGYRGGEALPVFLGDPRRAARWRCSRSA